MKVRVTLKEILSLAVGSYRFKKDTPVVVTNKELIKYVENSSWFVVEKLDDEKEVKKTSKSPRSTKVKSSDSEDSDETG